MSNTTLVTGHAGFIGRFLVQKLVLRGHRVRGIDISPCPRTGPFQEHVIGNILDETSVRGALENVDCIIHLAAEHKDFGVTESQYFLVNKKGTENLLRLASERQIKKFMLFSSVAVYGNQQATTEDTSPYPTTPYGSSKLEGENALKAWVAEQSSREAVIIRPSVVFGPRNNANIFRLIKQVCDRKFVWVGSGEPIKSIAYVENLVDAALFLLGRMKPGLEIFNYADTPHMKTKELVELIATKAGVSLPRVHVPLPVALSIAQVFDGLGVVLNHDFPLTSARIRKFATPTYHTAEKIRAVGFVPRYSIEEGIAENVKWYLEQGRDQWATTESFE